MHPFSVDGGSSAAGDSAEESSRSASQDRDCASAGDHASRGSGSTGRSLSRELAEAGRPSSKSRGNIMLTGSIVNGETVRVGSKASSSSSPSNQDSSRHRSGSAATRQRSCSQELGADDMLSQAIRNCGSLVQHSFRVRVLVMSNSLSDACRLDPKVDSQIPAFELKLDAAKLLDCLPQNPFDGPVCLQQGYFMGSKWLALYLCHASRAHQLKFTMAACALLNAGRKTGRCVAVEVDEAAGAVDGVDGEDAPDCAFLACSPLVSQRSTTSSARRCSWLDAAPELSELAALVLACKSGRATTELLRWARKPHMLGGLTTGAGEEEAGTVRPRANSVSDAATAGLASVMPSSLLRGAARPRSHSSCGLEAAAAAARLEVESSPSGKRGFVASAMDWLRKLGQTSRNVVQPLEGHFAALSAGDSRQSSRVPTQYGEKPSPSGRRPSSSSHASGSRSPEPRNKSKDGTSPSPKRGRGAASPSKSAKAGRQAKETTKRDHRVRRNSEPELFSSHRHDRSSSTAGEPAASVPSPEPAEGGDLGGQGTRRDESVNTLGRSVRRLNARATTLMHMEAVPEESEFERQVSKSSLADKSDEDEDSSQDSNDAQPPPASYLLRKRRSTGSSDVRCS